MTNHKRLITRYISKYKIKMSLKSKRISPRAMPLETILTRYKSSQMKQCNKTIKVNKHKPSQQKERSKHDINSNKQKRRSFINKTNKSDDIKYGEFHPDKRKRKVDIKKVILKPKHDYKVVVDANNCNKRKLNIPIKDVKRIRTNSDSSVTSEDSIHTVTEMITLLDATDNLNDEDLMEILTCPSPVWWEDPPEGYKEDSLSAQIRHVNKKPQDILIEENIESKLKDKNGPDKDKSKIYTNNKLNKMCNEKDTKYLKKQNKLEALLGNIKNKVKENKQSNKHHEEINIDRIKVSNNIDFKSNNDNKEKDKTVIKPDVYLDKSKTNKNPKGSTNNNQHINNTDNSIKSNRSLLLQNYISDSNNSDVDNVSENKIRTDKGVNYNENSKKIDENFSSNSETEYHNIKESDKSTEEKDKNLTDTNNVFDVSDLNSDETDDDLLNTSLDDDTLSILENMEIPIHDSGISHDSTTVNSPTNLQLGTTDSEINKTKTHRFTVDKVDDKSEIKLIDDGEKTNKINPKSDQNKSDFNITKALEKDTSDFVTVYKIISKNSSETEKNGNINSYFKKSKFKPKKSLDNLKDDTNDSLCKKRIVVSNKEMVKYCLKCSAIFNTEDCEYCIKKIQNA